METSTPITSPARKKHSLIQKFIPIDESLGDIESEIQSRRLEAINKSTETRRRSAAPLLAGYTASQLTQHCKDVIKLSTENKINSKNAFNFWLIDVMAAMSKKIDSEINKNFQVASCTLDASVKIYGYRVDAIHTDAFKMVGGFFNKDVQVTNDEEEKKTDTEKGEEATAKTKTKRKRKKLTVVPPENLNVKSEGDVLLEVIPRRNFLSRKTDGSDLLVKIPVYNDECLLLLDSDYPCWPYGDNSKIIPKLDSGKIFNQELLMPLITGVQMSSNDDLCVSYKDFEFGQVHQDGDSDDDLQTSQNSDRFEFDINASFHDNTLEDPVDQRNRIHIPAGGLDSDQEIIVEPEKKPKSVNLPISDMKSRLSINPSEYSMFDETFFKAWAGPAHWKVKSVRRPLEEFANNEDISKPVASKRTRKGKIKSHAGLFEIIEEVLEKNLAECEKTALFKSTMLNWSVQNTTMPKDLKCQSSNLFSLYHIPSYVITFKNDVADTSEISDHYNEEELNDDNRMEYCSPSIVRHGNESRHTDDEPNSSGGDEMWDSGNMVEPPHKIEKIHIATFKRRKHVDIKHLKRGLWNILTRSEIEGEKRVKVEEAIEFTKLIKSYPGKFSKNFTSLPSAPLIFNALLHLTNEKCLVLTQSKSDLLNFVISQQ